MTLRALPLPTATYHATRCRRVITDAVVARRLPGPAQAVRCRRRDLGLTSLRRGGSCRYALRHLSRRGPVPASVAASTDAAKEGGKGATPPPVNEKSAARLLKLLRLNAIVELAGGVAVLAGTNTHL